jgi:pimeloyl-ACP methyl ester carboxylesterase
VTSQPRQAVNPFLITTPPAELTELRARLRATRWPEPETVDDCSQGVPLGRLQELCRYWAEEYDWTATQDRLNRIPQFTTHLDGLDIHFQHVRSPHADATPLVLTHGWPGSFLEFERTLPALTDPSAFGGRAADAFHVVVPSLPGYGYSGKPARPGWTIHRIARAWAELMSRLGYARFLAAGSDWGTSTRPQTIGYALLDSPAGLCAWISEKLYAWTDNRDPDGPALSRNQILDDVMLYCLTGTAASSARLYRESIAEVSAWFTTSADDPVLVPTGCSVFPREVPRPSRRWAQRRFPNIVHWGEPQRGGHFAAWEQPDLFVEEVRAVARAVRSG